MSNTDIWDKVKKTDPKYTKDSSFGRKQTSIAPQYQIQEATKIFGPYGKGWGFKTCDLDLTHLDSLNLVLVRAVFFFVIDGEESSFVINNSWPVKIVKKRGSELSPDEDFAKKAETNTMSKALSRLGFSADIFMGEFDDKEYVDIVANEFAIEKADDKIEEAARQQLEYRDNCIKQVNAIKDAKTPGELKGLLGDFIRKATIRNDHNQIARLNKAAEDKSKNTQVTK
jgi:hypothetical protein